MFAKKEYEEGDVIICESPIVFGPRLEINTWICIACNCEIKDRKQCSKCLWPICDENCSMLRHHRSFECSIFKKNSVPFADSDTDALLSHQYSFILTLRLLLLKENEPSKWNIVMRDINPTAVDCKDGLESDTIKFIRTLCKLHQFDEGTILDAGYAVFTHSIKCNIPHQHMAGLYPSIHRIPHACRPNAFYFVSPNDDFKICVRAACAIKKNEQIYVSKISSVIAPTVPRRITLLCDELVLCECSRCVDPTELGTHLSSVKCHRCNIGYVTCSNPIDYTSRWKCSSCSRIYKYKKVQNLYKLIIKDLKEIEKQDKDLERCLPMLKAVINKYKSRLHPSNGFMVCIKMYCLISQFNNPYEIDLSDDAINEELNAAMDVVKVLDVITPGFNIYRAGILYIIYKLKVTLVINRKRRRSITSEQLKNDLLEAIEYGKLSCKMSKIFHGPPLRTDNSFSVDEEYIINNVDEVVKKYELGKN